MMSVIESKKLSNFLFLKNDKVHGLKINLGHN